MNKETKIRLNNLEKEFKKRWHSSDVSEMYSDRLKDALRERKYKGLTIFKIDIYTIERKKLVSNKEYAEKHFVQESFTLKSILEKERYPFTKLWLERTIYTIENNSIVELIDKEIKKKNSSDEIQYIFVTQIPCNKYSEIKYHYSGFPYLNYIFMRSYNYDGQLVDRTVTSSPFFGKLSVYYGRSLEQIRFNEGDIVEIADLYTEPCNPGIKLGRIIKRPLNIVEVCREDPNNCNYLSDAYKVAILNPKTMQLKKYSVPSINVFYPRFPISKELMDILNNAKVKESWE